MLCKTIAKSIIEVKLKSDASVFAPVDVSVCVWGIQRTISEWKPFTFYLDKKTEPNKGKWTIVSVRYTNDIVYLMECIEIKWNSSYFRNNYW